MTAKLYASSGDKASLWLHCSNQVEEVMNMWNNNDNFRKQYVDCNKNSVLRRSKTLDARSLGPGEKPSVPSDMNKILSTTVPTKVSLPKTLKAKELPPATRTVQKSQPTKMRKFNAATSKATRDSSAAPAPVMELIENSEKEKSMTKEEEELAQKEEVRKEKEAAELKERLKLEKMVKAKEAEERKKKQAEKAQARAEYRAQKEAELKEKKRTKKEKKKSSDVADATQIDDKEVRLKTTENNAAETFQEQQPEAQAASSSSKRNARSTVAAKKLNRVQPVPLLPRNCRRRKIGTWSWVILTAMLVIVLFLAGNYVSISTFSLPGFKF